MLWKQEVRSSAEKLLRDLIGSRTKDGFPFSFAFQAKVRTLAALSGGAISHDEVLGVIGSLNIRGSAANSFEQAYDAAKATRLAPVLRNYRLLLPLRNSIELTGRRRRPRSVTVFGHRFTFLQWGQASAAIGREAVVTALREVSGKLDPIPVTGTCVTCEVFDTNAVSAWEQMEPAFEAFRGLLLLTLHLGRVTYFTSRVRYKRLVPHPLWVLCHSPAEKIVVLPFITDAADESETPSILNHRMLEAFRKNASMLRSRQNTSSTLALIGDSLRLYAQAMDENLPHRRLLGLWQMAEAITLTSPGNAKAENVVNQAFWFPGAWKDSIPGIQHTVMTIADKRHDVVHRGLTGDVEEEDISILKSLCESALKWLTRNAGHFPTRMHVDFLYQFRTRPVEQLAAIRRCAGFLRRQQAGQSQLK